MRVTMLIFFLCIATAVNAETIVDNGDNGTLSTGSWSTSGGAGCYGTDSLYSRDTGATYAFSAPINGTCEVSLWWTEYSSRSTGVPVEIYDGDTLLDTVQVNQTAQGSQWNVLGTYDINGTARVVVVTESDSASTCADAVRFGDTVDMVDMEITVTWDRPDNTDNWAGLNIRVNGGAVIDVTDPDVTLWTGMVTLRPGSNMFEMQAYDDIGNFSVWTEPVYYTPGSGPPLAPTNVRITG